MIRFSFGFCSNAVIRMLLCCVAEEVYEAGRFPPYPEALAPN